MPKRAIISSMVMMVLGFFPLAAHEHDPIVSSGMLVEKANAWDGRSLSFMGEAIGEAMRRGSMCWIHLNDDAYMWKNIEEGTTLGGYNSGQAIWIPKDLAARIRFFGDYLHDGDVVRISGVFHAACREHGGDMDIHAVRLEIVRLGYPVPHKVNTRRLVHGLFMLSLAGLLFWMRVLARRKRI